MNAKFACATAGILILLTTVQQASAAIISVTYTGIVTQGTNYGPLGAYSRLDGQSYVASYMFDTALGYNSVTPNQTPTPGNPFVGFAQHYAFGGDNYGISSPALSAVLTINGISLTIQPNWNGTVYSVNDGGLDHVSGQAHEAMYSSVNGAVRTFNQSYSHIYNFEGSLPPSITSSITTPFSYSVQPNDVAISVFQFRDVDVHTNEINWGSVLFGQASITTLTVEVVSAVPLRPSTWPMMILGLAGAGFITYRRRRGGKADAGCQPYLVR